MPASLPRARSRGIYVININLISRKHLSSRTSPSALRQLLQGLHRKKPFQNRSTLPSSSVGILGTALGMKGIPDLWSILRNMPIENGSIKDIYPPSIGWDSIIDATDVDIT